MSAGPAPRVEQCEWNPGAGREAYWDEADHAPAVFGVGELYLCASCAALPRFHRFKKRPLSAAPSRPAGRAAAETEDGHG